MTLNKLTRQLYPTGRAFRFAAGGNAALLHDAINSTVDICITSIKGILDTILPDNDNFTIEDAAIWEDRLGLVGAGSFDDRKKAIMRKLNYPGNCLGRLSRLYFQAQLRAAGFDVYVHDNRFSDGMGGFKTINPGDGSGTYTPHGVGIHGVSLHGATGFPYNSVITNHEDKAFEPVALYSGDQLKMTFFIGSEVFPNAAFVPASREREFRKLILTLKSQHMVGYMLINYV